MTMNVFIPYENSSLTAHTLDNKRLNKQIIECYQMLSALRGESKAWLNHPATQMYKGFEYWLEWYAEVLKFEQLKRKGNNTNVFSLVEPERPYFIGWSDLHKAHQARLFQKSNVMYPHFEKNSNFTENNWYVVDGEVREYNDGKIKKRYKYVDSCK